MKNIIHIVFAFLIIFSANAEGTKQLMPNNTGKCYVQFNETIGGQRYFALTTNTDTLHRLYIHIKTAGEVINLGFKALAGSSDARFRIKDPAGNVVYAFTAVPTSGAGYISTFDQASIGPNSLVGGAGGYTPFTYTTISTGDYYIEFEKTANPTVRFLFEFFDITVSTAAAGTAINGRLWSYAWDLNTNSFTNVAYPVFYVYSADKYVSTVNINGMQPYSFVIACNNTGSHNTGDLFTARQSVPSANTVIPQYKIFLNRPDPTIYDEALIPTMIENLRVNGTPMANQPVEFYVNMTQGGTLEIFLDIDGDPGYQSGGRDVVLVKHIESGGDIIEWDGKDGLGDQVTTTISVIVSSKFATGVTHLPVYDAEKNANGFLVTRIAPSGPENLVLYWDDSQINHGTIPVSQQITMLSGNTTANGHIWTTDSGNSDGFGNVHTLNTWWNGFEIDNLATFDFILLPIELVSWKAIYKGTYVHLSWITATETNNHLFHIQRSYNGIDWTTISTVIGAGNSSKNTYYNEIDENLYLGISYYRLQQVDFDGTISFSPVISVGTRTINDKVNVYTDKENNFITLEQYGVKIQDVKVLDINGYFLNNYVQFTQIDGSTIKINVTKLPKGSYIIRTNKGAIAFYLL